MKKRIAKKYLPFLQSLAEKKDVKLTKSNLTFMKNLNKANRKHHSLATFSIPDFDQFQQDVLNDTDSYHNLHANENNPNNHLYRHSKTKSSNRIWHKK